MSNPLIIKTVSKTQIIKFNNPQERNPISVSILNELHKIFDKTANNEQINSIIFTGTYDIFASGANLREIAAITEENVKEFALRGQDLMNKIAELNTIAAINGFCFGGAFDLALACRQRIASPNALFSHPGANLGIMTGWGGTQRLPRIVGEAKALEIFLTAKRVNAEEALKIGLIDKIAKNPLIFALKMLEA
jgi:enoyl-CoA hydratase/carnithine racemase